LELIQIIGSGRSGSTIAEALLAKSNDALPIGELMYIWDRGFLEDWTCACGKSFSKCEFWHAVLKDTGLDKLHKVDIGNFLKLRKKYASIRSVFYRMFASNFDEKNKQEQSELIDAYRTIYRVASNLSGKKVIVDSSKEPGHAIMLRDIGISSTIHLTRNPLGVVNSWKQNKLNHANNSLMPRQGIVSSAAEWAIVNDLILHANKKKLITNYNHWQYEKICDDTKLTEESSVMISNKEICRNDFGHSISGNPTRFKNQQTIVLDDYWKKSLTKAEKTIIRLITEHTTRKLSN
jgi:hypothetical protein